MSIRVCHEGTLGVYEHRIHAVQNILPMVARGQITRALMPELELRRLEGQALCYRMDAKQMPEEDHWLLATLLCVRHTF